MTKRTLIVIAAIVFIIVISITVFLLRLDFGGRKGTQLEPKGNNLIISRLPNGWQQIEHPLFNIAFEIPPAWKTTLIGENLESNFSSDDFRAEASVYKYSNPDNISLEKWLEPNKIDETSKINKGAVEGLRYVGKEIVESYKGNELKSVLVDESYVVGNIFKLKDKILNISCTVTGPNYKSFIPTCEEIVKSLNFIK